MISVIIPTFNAAATLADTLDCLIPAAVSGLVREVVVADGGSTDGTIAIADGCGAETVAAGRDRSSQLIAGAQRARHPWLLFLNADCVLEPGWTRDADQFMHRIDEGARPSQAAVFRYAIDDEGVQARAFEGLVRLRGALFGLPSGEQALLMPRKLYTDAGGFRPLPLLEDTDLAWRLGRGRLTRLRTTAVTQGARYRERGYGANAAMGLGLLLAYALNIPLGRIARRPPPAAEAASG